MNKRTIYKSIIRPVWLYGIQLRRTTKTSNIIYITLQAFQSICLRLINSAPWHITNYNLHKNLKLRTINNPAKFYSKLLSYSNPLIKKLSSITHFYPRRLKRRWSRDLLNAQYLKYKCTGQMALPKAFLFLTL